MPLQSANQPQVLELVQWPAGGVNQSTRRSVIGDEDLWYMENFFPLALGELRTAWGPSAPIYTAPAGQTILRFACTSIDGQNPIAIVFLSGGIVEQVNLNTGAVVAIGSIWQPVAPHYWAAVKLWRPNYFGATAALLPAYWSHRHRRRHRRNPLPRLRPRRPLRRQRRLPRSQTTSTSSAT